jgi:hypothetical protein
MEAGGWRLEAGGWRLEAGGWRLEAGGEFFRIKKKCRPKNLQFYLSERKGGWRRLKNNTKLIHMLQKRFKKKLAPGSR